MDTRLKNLWERENWPNFFWQIETIKPKLDSIRLLQGRLLGKLDDLPVSFEHQAQVDILVENVMRNRGVADQFINLESFMNSACGFVQQEHQDPSDIDEESISSLLNLWIEIGNQPQQNLSSRKLAYWHEALFSNQLTNQAETTFMPYGVLRTDQIPQLAINKTLNEEIHYEPPPQFTVNLELLGFLQWYNHKPEGLDSLLRAGIAHLWFMALQPYEKGNGRLARIVTDLALAQSESSSFKYYSLSSSIAINRSFYNRCLGVALDGDLDLTQWLTDFLTMLEDAILQGISRINHFMRKTRYWQKHSQTLLNARQLKLLNTLLDAKEKDEDTANIYASKYMSITSVSKATATRELSDLLQKNCIRKLPGGGRNTRYVIA